MGKPGKSSRPSALLSARWQDIDLTARLWHIPAADMKTKHPFTVPLSDWAVEILRELTHRPATTSTFSPASAHGANPPPIPTTSASNSPTTPSDDWAMTAAPPANPNTQCTDSATSSPTSA
nr:tyrosine-type recombinase/integrase [Neisseria meningitidis]